jgi:formylglycine-generating enzyme required for sulfatase activity
MRRLVWVAPALVFLTLAGATSPLAEKRIALLIGNEAYSSEIGRLGNPHNDVALLEQTLKRLDFEVVTVRDAGLGALDRAVNAYARRVQAAESGAVGFFYYSGHGASDGGTNYLIPVDVQTTETGELWDQSLRLTEITRKLKVEAGNATHFVVFDACRNTLRLTQPGSRAIVQSKGFIPVAQENGMLIAYATAEGELASDVGSGAGPYAKALAEEIVKPGIEAVVMFRAVQRRVRAAIHQEPYLGFNALGDVYFAGKPDTVVSTGEAERAWAAVKDTKSPEVLQSFIERYKDTIYAELARAQKRDLETLRRNTEIALEMQMKRLEEAEKQAKEQRATELKKQQVAIVPAPATQPLLPNLIDKTLGNVLPPAAGNCDGVEITVGEKEQRCFKPGAGKTESFKDCPTCPEMVVVPAGSFTMGSPANEPVRGSDETQVRILIARPFAVGKFAVTFDEWEVCIANGGCRGYRPDDSGYGRGKLPVINVNWEDAKAFVAWLSNRTGKEYRLPSEAEREYFTRAGTTTPFWWGSKISTAQANHDGRQPHGYGPEGSARSGTLLVDSYEPNPWGLFQVHGNVSEWTEDCWNDSNSGNPGDGSARATGDCSRHVARGGSWGNLAPALRSASREPAQAGERFFIYGFRLARTLP